MPLNANDLNILKIQILKAKKMGILRRNQSFDKSKKHCDRNKACL